MQNRPLYFPEEELARLIALGIAEGVLSPLFLTKVHEAMPARNEARMSTRLVHTKP